MYLVNPYLSQMENKIGKGVIDPVNYVPLINVAIGGDSSLANINAINRNVLRAMIDTGSELSWIKFTDIEKFSLIKTNKIRRVFAVSENDILSKEIYRGCVYFECNGIICEVEFGILPDDFMYDAIIGTDVISKFIFTYNPKLMTFTLECLL